MAFDPTDDLKLLNRDLGRYQTLTRKTPEDVILKQGGKLAFNLSRRLRNLAPGSGVVTSDRLAALKAGEGIYVRPKVRQSVYQRLGRRTGSKVTIGKGAAKTSKWLNRQAQAVKRELALRESGRGFISYASRFGALKGIKPGQRQDQLSRYKQVLGSVGFTVKAASASLRFVWGGQSTRASRVATVLQQPAAKAQVTAALRETAADIRSYNDRKMRENREKAFGGKAK